MQEKKHPRKNTSSLWTVSWGPLGTSPLDSVHADVHWGDRNEIASCEESAYESLPLKDAATLLFFTSQSDLLKFAQQVCSCLGCPLRQH